MAAATGNQVSVIYVPSDVGSIYAGKAKAPDAIKSVGLVEKLKQASYRVSEHEALPKPIIWTSSAIGQNGARNEDVVVDVCHYVKDSVTNTLSASGLQSTSPPGTHPPLTFVVGGECLMVPAIMSALANHYGASKRVGLLYVDADCDMLIPGEPGSSGNLAGMAGTHLTLRTGALESMKPFSGPNGSGVVDSENMVFFGLNHDSPANKPHHLAYLFDEHFRVFTKRAVAADAKGAAEMALKWLGERVDYILIHLDVDAIDPGEFPLCNVPSSTDVSFEKIMTAMKVFLKSPKIVGLSLAEVNPDHDPGLIMTRRLVEELVAGLESRLQTS